jgi:hypothetical protein
LLYVVSPFQTSFHKPSQPAVNGAPPHLQITGYLVYRFSLPY